jgi:hypothetical protein
MAAPKETLTPVVCDRALVPDYRQNAAAQPPDSLVIAEGMAGVVPARATMRLLAVAYAKYGRRCTHPVISWQRSSPMANFPLPTTPISGVALSNA